MILLTRLNGEKFALNVDLIERAEMTPDTVIRTVDGSNYVVSESLEEVIGRVVEFKAAVLHKAATEHGEIPFKTSTRTPNDRLHLVQGTSEDNPDPGSNG